MTQVFVLHPHRHFCIFGQNPQTEVDRSTWLVPEDRADPQRQRRLPENLITLKPQKFQAGVVDFETAPGFQVNRQKVP